MTSHTQRSTLFLCLFLNRQVPPHRPSFCKFELAAINTLLLWFRVLELLGGLRATGAYIAMFFAVTADIAYFMAILVVFWLQNGFSLQLLYGGEQALPSAEIESLPDALWTSFNMMPVPVSPLPTTHTWERSVGRRGRTQQPPSSALPASSSSSAPAGVRAACASHARPPRPATAPAWR